VTKPPGSPSSALPASEVLPAYRLLAALIAGSHIPPTLAPAGYNSARARLWLRFFKRSTVPTQDEFDAAMNELYDLLASSAFPRGGWVGGEQGEALMKAKLRLDDAYRVGYASEVTATRLDDDAGEEWRDRDTTSARGVRGAWWIGPAR
jgi:hypothetical protein